MRKQGVIIIIFIALWIVIEASALLAQPHFPTLTGTVVAIQGGARKWLEVRSDTDGVTFNLRIGRNTVYYPYRYPKIGERVRVLYITEKGVHIATKVSILTKEKEEGKRETPETGNGNEDEDQD